jgi:hypothetical protein
MRNSPLPIPSLSPSHAHSHRRTAHMSVRPVLCVSAPSDYVIFSTFSESEYVLINVFCVQLWS